MVADRGWWDRPVRVLVDGVSTVSNVSNTVQAARLLAEGWPGASGPKLRAARRAVLKAMQSHMDAKARARARDAFEAAAREAGISVD